MAVEIPSGHSLQVFDSDFHLVARADRILLRAKGRTRAGKEKKKENREPGARQRRKKKKKLVSQSTDKTDV